MTDRRPAVKAIAGVVGSIIVLVLRKGIAAVMRLSGESRLDGLCLRAAGLQL